MLCTRLQQTEKKQEGGENIRGSGDRDDKVTQMAIAQDLFFIRSSFPLTLLKLMIYTFTSILTSRNTCVGIYGLSLFLAQAMFTSRWLPDVQMRDTKGIMKYNSAIEPPRVYV